MWIKRTATQWHFFDQLTGAGGEPARQRTEPAGGPAERPDIVVCLINEQAYERPPGLCRSVKCRIVGKAKIVAKPDDDRISVGAMVSAAHARDLLPSH